MSRGPIYTQRVLAKASPRRRHVEDPMGPPLAGQENVAPDGYAEKLVKYVPAEVVAFLAATSAAEVSRGVRWLIVASAAVGGVVYVSRDGRRPWWFYTLSMVATAGWVAGTTNYAEALLSWKPSSGGVLLAVVVFLVPGIDEVLSRRTDKP